MQNFYYGSLFLASTGIGTVLAIVFGVLFAIAAVLAVIFFISHRNLKRISAP